MDIKKLEEVGVQFLKSLDDDPKREGLLDTPKRFAAACKALYSGYNQKPEDVMRVFDDESYDEMIVVKDIEFYSTCEHHLIPFYGKAHIGYIPNGKIAGLSKMPRIVEIFSRRLQNQERLTSQIAKAMDDLLKPKGVGVILEAKHLCMMARGVEKQNAVVTTSTLTGLFKNNINTRSEFLRHLER
ncbi:GTP cyclohydrolase I FolE [bacterium]|nr:GTP cyclohydrolase I FolE [bacterium]